MHPFHMHPFQVMAEPVRRRIVDVLASGEHTSGEIAEVVGGEFAISATAISKHLRRMLDSGFVDVRADMTTRVYWNVPDRPHVANTIAFKGSGKPSQRGRRGKGYRDEPWQRFLPR